MLEVLWITIPFFALVLTGYAATRLGWLPLDSIAGLNIFVLYFALPCMLFRFGSSTPLGQLLDGPLFLTYLACALLLLVLSVSLSFGTRTRWNDTAFGALVAAFPNTGFMGIPMLHALLGAAAVGPVIVTILVDLVITTSLCIALSRLDFAGSHGVKVALQRALKGVLVNPMPWAIGLGAFTSGMQLEWPRPFQTTVGFLADAASPCALFTLGAVLARSSIVRRAAFRRNPDRQTPPWSEHGKLVIIKLLLHPLLVLLLGCFVISIDVGIDPFAVLVAVLVAALPSANNVVLLAERFKADSGRIARIVFETTAVSFVSFSVAVICLT